MIEIDINKLERGTHEGHVLVTRDGKSFYQTRRLGRKEKPKTLLTERTVKIKAKSGDELPLVISGTKQEPIIKVHGSFLMRGKKITGPAIIQHWKNKGAEEGLFFNKPKVYIQCAAEISKVKDIISKLPTKKYVAKKVDVTVDADGHKITTGKWEFDRSMRTKNDTLIPDWEMSRFLDNKGVIEIDIEDAVKMWEDEKEAKYLSRNIKGDKKAKAMFEDDIADVGYDQACENAGIPKNLR